MLQQAFGPLPERTGPCRQSHRLARACLAQQRRQVFQQDRPGDGVDDEVMDDQQQAVRSPLALSEWTTGAGTSQAEPGSPLAEVEPGEAQQRALGEIQAGL